MNIDKFGGSKASLEKNYKSVCVYWNSIVYVCSALFNVFFGEYSKSLRLITEVNDQTSCIANFYNQSTESTGVENFISLNYRDILISRKKIYA